MTNKVLTRPLALFSILAAAACSPEPRPAFPVGFLEPVPARVAAEARRRGLEIAAQAPTGAAIVSAALPFKDGGGEAAADWARLRFLAARAIAGGSAGVFLRLPRTQDGRDLLDYAEEWQAVERVARELLLMRPIMQDGAPASAPFAVPAGIELRAWSFRGRRYALLVNSSGAPLPLEQKSLEPWRALFAVRSDAREILAACGTASCLPPEGVLWLEGRLLPEIRP
jgi:hypothetical protein